MVGVLLVLATPVWAHGSNDQRSAALEARLLLAPVDPALHLRRAEMLLDEGRQLEATAALLTAENLGASPAACDALRARIALADGRPNDALLAADRALAAGGSAGLERLRARALLELGRTGEAASAWLRLLAAEPNPSPDDYLDTARASRANGDRLQALHVLDRGLQQLGPLAALQQLAIEIEVEMQSYAAALARLDVLLARNPRNRQWLARRQQILSLVGTADAAPGNGDT